MECQQLRIRLLPSRRIAAIACVLQPLAVAALAFVDMPAWLACSFAAALIIEWLWQLRGHRAAVRHETWLIRTPDGWLLQCGSVVDPVVIDPATMVTGSVVVLRLRSARRRHTFVLGSDTLADREWRALRVALRIGSAAGQPGVRIVSSASGARSG